MRFRMLIEYDGSDFSGWQLQKNVSTIQGALEDALFKISGQTIRVHGAGRTDAGVHARGQVAHFDILKPHIETKKLRNAVNSLTPGSIIVNQLESVSEDFHSRYSAVSRRYRYYISTKPLAIGRQYAWLFKSELDDVKIEKFCEYLKNKKDFTSFSKVTENMEHYLCDIHFSNWIRSKDDFLIFEIEANRFLHGMVRALVGTLVKVGTGKLILSDLEKIFIGKDRRLAAMAAPACGLFLEEVKYQ